jgi:CheY-like chemotaxis protein
VATILLIDDTTDSAEPLARLLRLNGHVVRHAPDGLAALAALAPLNPDLILLDLHMPHLDGLGFLRHLRQDPAYARWSNTPVILTTASAPGQTLDAARALGISRCLTKAAFTVTDLESSIQHALAPRTPNPSPQD